MRILSVAYPLLPVGVDSAGGAEQVLYQIDRGLGAAAHESLVIASGDSKIAGELITGLPQCGEITEARMSEAQQVHRELIENTIRMRQPDCVHFHGLDFPEYLSITAAPVVATVHLPGDWYASSAFQAGGVQLVCVSRSQAKTLPCPSQIVENGIDVDRIARPNRKRDTLLWLGRICPEKGVHLALQAAHIAGKPLIVAGPVHAFRSHQDYFNREVKPLLDQHRTYIGPVSFNQKADLLARAEGLLVPSLAAETSSLVAMEALAAGTPVVALRSGALPEVVEDGHTGWIVDSVEAMTGALEKLSEIDEEDCRRAAQERFSAGRMVADYLTLYRRTINRDRDSATAPQDRLYGSSPRRKSHAV